MAMHAEIGHSLLIEMQKSNSKDGPHLWVCESCKDHGVIYIPNGRSLPLKSKPQAMMIIQKMHDRKIVNLLEKKEVEKSIIESTLPDTDPQDQKMWN
jgi:hypothetical protein